MVIFLSVLGKFLGNHLFVLLFIVSFKNHLVIVLVKVSFSYYLVTVHIIGVHHVIRTPLRHCWGRVEHWNEIQLHPTTKLRSPPAVAAWSTSFAGVNRTCMVHRIFSFHYHMLTVNTLERNFQNLNTVYYFTQHQKLDAQKSECRRVKMKPSSNKKNHSSVVAENANRTYMASSGIAVPHCTLTMAIRLLSAQSMYMDLGRLSFH